MPSHGQLHLVVGRKEVDHSNFLLLTTINCRVILHAWKIIFCSLVSTWSEAQGLVEPTSHHNKPNCLFCVICRLVEVKPTTKESVKNDNSWHLWYIFLATTLDLVFLCVTNQHFFQKMSKLCLWDIFQWYTLIRYVVL